MQIYNSLTKQKEDFKPITPGKVGIYVCGMTVYDDCHIGHARLFMSFDIIARYLRYRDYEVTFVRNITDIDDKIINRANDNQESHDDLTNRMIASMHEDFAALGILKPDLEPRATGHIDEIISMIETLISKGYAYQGENKDVYYNVEKFVNYGKLAHKNIDELKVGARIGIEEAKHNPLDFVLWKAQKPGEPAWDSPWGPGRPGWHIECSAMSTKCLGNHFDIHGGGADLLFPHHENELAQAEAATDQPFVNTWCHVGFLQVNKEKMSKSLGNFFTIKDVLAKYRAETIRYFLISSHYRSPINYSTESLQIADGALMRFYTSLRGLGTGTRPENSDYEIRFQAAMDDDFNTPQALAVMFDITHEINRIREKNLEQANNLGTLLRYLGDALGILQDDPEAFLHAPQGFHEAISSDEIEALITKRNQAREDRDWAMADQIRDELADKGVMLEDGANGTIWRREA